MCEIWRECERYVENEKEGEHDRNEECRGEQRRGQKHRDRRRRSHRVVEGLNSGRRIEREQKRVREAETKIGEGDHNKNAKKGNTTKRDLSFLLHPPTAKNTGE